MKNTISIFSLDPGSTFGWAKSIVTLDGSKMSMKVTDHSIVDLNALTVLRMRQDSNLIYNKHRTRMMIYQQTLQRLTTMIKFDVFCIEDVFLNARFVNSFRALVIYTEMLEHIVNVDRKQILHRVTPTLVKSHISGYGHADKLLVQKSLLENKHIKISHPESLREHSADAIAVAYAFVSRMMQSV